MAPALSSDFASKWDKKIVQVRLLRSLSRTGDHKNKEHKCSFLLWSGASGGRKSPTASPQINQKNKKASFLFFRFIGASGGSRTLVSSLGRKYNSRYTTLA